MAAVQWNRIGKYLKDFSLHFRRNRRKRTEDEDEEQEDKEYSGDTRDESPGDIQMGNGTHKPVYGIRRKIIGGVIIAFVVAFSGGYLFMSGGEKGEQKPALKTTASEVSKPSQEGKTGDAKAGDVSYQDLKKLENQKKAQDQAAKDARTQAGNRTTSSANAMQGTDGTMAAVQQTRRMQASTSVASGVMPSPILPSSTGAAASVTKSSQSETAEQRMEKRYASAIEFALGRSTSPVSPTPSTTTSSHMTLTSMDAGSMGNAVSSPNGIQDAQVSPVSDDVFAIQAGTMIPAMLFTGIDTDAPGQVMAQVRADVYDSLTQSNLLIPAGARLLGSYTGNTNGNGRVAVTFTTLILPSGAAYDIGQSMVATDGNGYHGIVGTVHRHTGRKMSAGMISSALAALASYASGDSSAQNSFTGGQLAMQGAMANLINSTSSMISRAADIKTTVTVAPGHLFTIYVEQPISFGSASL